MRFGETPEDDSRTSIQEMIYKLEILESFVENTFEIAFGDNAYYREYSFGEVLERLREYSDLALELEEKEWELT